MSCCFCCFQHRGGAIEQLTFIVVNAPGFGFASVNRSSTKNASCYLPPNDRKKVPTFIHETWPSRSLWGQNVWYQCIIWGISLSHSTVNSRSIQSEEIIKRINCATHSRNRSCTGTIMESDIWIDMEKSMWFCHMCLRAQSTGLIVHFFHYFPFFYSINDKIRIILWFFYQLAVIAYARVDQTDTKPAKCLRLFDAEKCLSPCQWFLISATINKTQQWRTIASEQENRRHK